MILKLETELAVKEEEVDGALLTTPSEVAAYLEEIKNAAQECFIVITLNTKNRAIRKHLVSIGTLNSTLVHPRECFRPAILDGAAAIIVAHNHPSGDPSPSSEDIKVTRQLIRAGEIMGIKVLDHVIVGGRSLSLREESLCEF